MNDIKLSLTMVVQGATIMSKQECLKQLKKPVMVKKGKYAGKQVRDKKGNLVWKYSQVPDYSKFDKNEVAISTPDGKKEVITFFTRKSREAQQVINMCTEAYLHFIGDEVPQGYHAPKEFKPFTNIRSYTDRKTGEWVQGMSLDKQAWSMLTPIQRLEINLHLVCQSLGGVLKSYTVFND